jgi:hypothetical protein
MNGHRRGTIRLRANHTGSSLHSRTCPSGLREEERHLGPATVRLEKMSQFQPRQMKE